ncbi:MAG TPA: OsmC family protein [Lacibacter sp.]|jgi:uncharacterized OsmC-like protein|nr:OsmC family protein [Lacibacter sp.]
MHISASVRNAAQQNEVLVTTNHVSKQVTIPAKTEGMGSSVNGGELLFLALATCFCNDVYREAAKRKLKINSVEVKVSGEFGAEGEPGRNIQYEVNVDADAEEAIINELIAYVDKIAEVHNTLRVGTAVTLKEWRQ